MTNEEIALKLQGVSDKADRNEGRIKKLEESTATLHELATSVAVMANQLKTLNSNVVSMQVDVAELKNKPAKRWDAIVEKAIPAVLGALVVYALGRIGL